MLMIVVFCSSAERDEKADDFDDNQSQASSHRSELYESMYV
jgi:hypothetical protein